MKGLMESPSGEPVRRQSHLEGHKHIRDGKSCQVNTRFISHSETCFRQVTSASDNNDGSQCHHTHFTNDEVEA